MSLKQFVKVMPTDYKRVLADRKRHDEEVEQTLHSEETGTFAVHGR
jgi:glutamate synthase domain-containing protein 3